MTRKTQPLSEGTLIYSVRLPQDLVAEVMLTIDRRNNHTREEPWVLSDFIRIALKREMRKMTRSRKRTR